MGKKYIDRELAEIFDCSTEKIREAYKRGKLHGDKNPKTGRVYYSQQDVDDYKKYLSSMISVKDFAERVGVPVETLRTEIRNRKFLAREEEGYENHGYFTESDVGEYLAMKNKQRDNGRMSEERKKILLDRARKLQMNFPKNVNTLFDIAYASNDKKLCLECREIAGRKAREYKEKDPKRALEFVEIYKKTLLMTARDNFDSYLQYIEWNRPADKKFYLPRRPQLKVVVDALQDLADDKLDLLAISLPPGVGKTTLAIFFLTWIGGKNPELPLLGSSHNAGFLRGVYDEVLRILDKDGEYLWHDVFPELEVNQTNSNILMINIGDPKRFMTFEFSSVEAQNAGKVRAQSLLYLNDTHYVFVSNGISTGDNVFYTSKDGLNWTEHESTVIFPLVNVDSLTPIVRSPAIYADNKYIIKTKTGSIYSTNGTDWINTGPAREALCPIVYFNGMFISTDSISENGINWTSTDSEISIYDLAVFNDKLIGISGIPTTFYYATE